MRTTEPPLAAAPLPCARCSYPPLVIYENGQWLVSCSTSSCEADGVEDDTRVAAIEAWNERQETK